MKNNALALFLVFLGFIGFAEQIKGLETPQTTVVTHLEALKYENDSAAASTIYAPKLSLEQKVEIAYNIRAVYDGAAHYIETQYIPNEPGFVNPRSKDHMYVVDSAFSGIYLRRYDGEWKYSAATVKNMPSILKKAFPYGTHKLLNVFKGGHGTQMFGLDLWKLTALLILGVAAVLIYAVSIIIFQVLATTILERVFKKKKDKDFIRPIVKPLGLILVFAFLSLFIPVLQLSILLGKILVLGTKAAIPIFTMVFAYRMVDVLSIYFEKLADRTESKLDDQLVPLIRKALKAFVVVIGVLFTLQNLNFNITALLAGVSIGGLAIALAAQDMLKNFFGSLTIFMDRPFQIGDWVMGPGIDGTIEEVGFRSTRIRTFENSLVSVPNGTVADATINNMGKRAVRRYSTSISVTYDTPPTQVEAFVNGLKKIVEDHPNTVKDNYHVYLTSLTSSSLDILFYIFFDVPDWGAELRCKQEVNLSILKLADEMDVRFAFNTQTVHIEDFPEKASLTPSKYPSKEDLNSAVTSFESYK